MVNPDPSSNEFEKAGKSAPSSNIFKDYIDFLAHRKKWWMLPIILVLFLMGLLIILGGTGAAPFIYSLF